MSARHSAPLIFRLCPSIANLSGSGEAKADAQPLRRIVTRRRETAGAMQPRHRAERAEPGSKNRKRDVEHIPGVTDHREGGKEIPDRAPIRCPDASSARYRRIEEHVGRVGCRGRSEHAKRESWKSFPH